MDYCITGIQQVGIGVENAVKAKYLYKDLFGMNTLIFEDIASASLMTRYTGNEIHSRHAILTLNLNGGGGFEIWQFTSRAAATPFKKIYPGDLGLYAVKIKCRSAKKAHEEFSKKENLTLSALYDDFTNRKYFWLTEELGNHFQVVETNDWFNKKNHNNGGVFGAVIGVKNMERSINFYKDVLGMDEIMYDKTSCFEGHASQEMNQQFRSVLLNKKISEKGAFSKLLGGFQIELIERKDSYPKRIFEDRYWGDTGFIHICFDVLNMDKFKERLCKAGYSFTVDSKDSFKMGTSTGRFCYLEDPDGTLIELVETHKIPILKKAGLYLDLQKMNAAKRLPDWVIKLMSISKVH